MAALHNAIELAGFVVVHAWVSCVEDGAKEPERHLVASLNLLRMCTDPGAEFAESPGIYSEGDRAAALGLGSAIMAEYWYTVLSLYYVMDWDDIAILRREDLDINEKEDLLQFIPPSLHMSYEDYEGMTDAIDWLE